MAQYANFFTFKNPTWLESYGFSKGIRHDHEDLGIILYPGSSITLSQDANSFNKGFNARLLTDGSKTEVESFNIGQTPVTLTAKAESVVFIERVYHHADDKLFGNLLVKYEIHGKSIPLPIHEHGGNLEQFFDAWGDAPFALLKSRDIQFLLSSRDKDKIKSPSPYKDINNILDVYQQVFKHYNDLAGLSFNSENPVHENVPNKYLVKEDKDCDNGIGGYYSSKYTVSCAPVSEWWIRSWSHEGTWGWGPLHEIGHGYEANFAQDYTFDAVDTWNNIYAATYQDKYIRNGQEIGWMTRSAYKDDYATIKKNIAESIPLRSWDHFPALRMIMSMLDKAGLDSFTFFNKAYREAWHSDKIQLGQYSLMGMLAESIAQTSDIDVVPYLQICNAFTSPYLLLRQVIHANKPVAPIFALITNEVQQVKVQKALGALTPLSLVHTKDLIEFGMLSSVTINLLIDDISQILGTEISLIDNINNPITRVIEDEHVVFKDIPVGVYRFAVSFGKDKIYSVDTNYVIASEGTKELNVTWNEQHFSKILDRQVNFYGHGEALVATLLINYSDCHLHFDILSSTPHLLEEDRLYFSLNVFDSNGYQVFTKNVQGTGVAKEGFTIPFDIDYTFEIFHQETHNRLTSNMGQTYHSFIPEQKSNIINTKSQKNYFTITSHGLVNRDLQNNPAVDFENFLDKIVTHCINDSILQSTKYNFVRDDVLLGIKQLPHDKQAVAMKKYKQCLPEQSDTETSIHVKGTLFQWQFYGANDKLLASAMLIYDAHQITFKVEDVLMPNDATNKLYASMTIMSSSDIELYRWICNGTSSTRATDVTISVQPNDKVLLTHLENTSLVMRSIEQGKINVDSSYILMTIGESEVTIQQMNEDTFSSNLEILQVNPQEFMIDRGVFVNQHDDVRHHDEL
ncbi:MAG: putative mucin/carbohydrate-binding domain-containing protein [Candidatus Lariskella arthropodorum]